jgi:hypothetical protein
MFIKALHAPLQQSLQTRGVDTFERAVKVAIKLEDAIWAMSDYKTSNKEKQGGDTSCLAEEDTQKVNSSTVPAPTDDTTSNQLEVQPRLRAQTPAKAEAVGRGTGE